MKPLILFLFNFHENVLEIYFIFVPSLSLLMDPPPILLPPPLPLPPIYHHLYSFTYLKCKTIIISIISMLNLYSFFYVENISTYN